MLPQAFIDEMKQKLLASKQQLTEELAGLSPHQELGSDLDSSAQEVEDDEVSQDVMTRIKSDLEKINRALEKIEHGKYGLDDNGAQISQDRLKAIPWADKAL